MTKHFKEAFESGLVQPAVLWNGQPFVVNNIQYYEPTADGANMLIGRFHGLSDTLHRHDALKVSEDVQRSYLASMEMLSNRIIAQATLDPQQVIDAAVDMKVLTERMKTRMDFGVTIELMYDIASITYFSENEDPGAIDSDTNKKKIQDWLNWEQSSELYAFFLQSPIEQYVPYESLSSGNILKYIQLANEMELLDLTKMLLKLRTAGSNNAMTSTFESRRETLFAYDGLIEQLLKTTTPTEVHS